MCDIKSRKIGEASMRDDTHGIGPHIHQKDIFEKSKWIGRNELGHILMTLETLLIYKYKQRQKLDKQA